MNAKTVLAAVVSGMISLIGMLVYTDRVSFSTRNAYPAHLIREGTVVNVECEVVTYRSLSGTTQFLSAKAEHSLESGYIRARADFAEDSSVLATAAWGTAFYKPSGDVEADRIISACLPRMR